MSYVKVIYLTEGKKRTTIWADLERESSKMLLLLPLSAEGNDFGRVRRDGSIEVPKLLLDKTLVVRISPAYLHKKYGTLRVGMEPLGRYWER